MYVSVHGWREKRLDANLEAMTDLYAEIVKVHNLRHHAECFPVWSESLGNDRINCVSAVKLESCA
jgi:hypothetical protein